MKLLNWNIKSLGNPLTFHNLKRILKSHSSDILFLIETKNKINFIGNKLKNYYFFYVIFVDPSNLSRGLVVAWKYSYDFILIHHENFFLHTCIMDPLLIWIGTSFLFIWVLFQIFVKLNLITSHHTSFTLGTN